MSLHFFYLAIPSPEFYVNPGVSSKPASTSSITGATSASMSMLLMPLTPGEGAVLPPSPPAKDSTNAVAASYTPKWIAPALLFIDLYEKIFLAARKRMALLKVTFFWQ